jgi:hypothetical protein
MLASKEEAGYKRVRHNLEKVIHFPSTSKNKSFEMVCKIETVDI